MSAVDRVIRLTVKVRESTVDLSDLLLTILSNVENAFNSIRQCTVLTCLIT